MAQIQIGNRFRKIGDRWMVWQVVGTVKDEEGVPHYLIADTNDRTNVKTISAIALADTARYEPV